MPHPGILPSPLRDKVGVFDHDRFRGYVSVHFRSGLHPPCLRFAVAVAGHHARLGTRLLVRLCRGRHFRQLNFMRFQGATLTNPIGSSVMPWRLSNGLALSDKAGIVALWKEDRRLRNVSVPRCKPTASPV